MEHDRVFNLVQLAADVREEGGKPELPVVIGELGNGGPEAGKNMLEIRASEKIQATVLELLRQVAPEERGM